MRAGSLQDKTAVSLAPMQHAKAQSAAPAVASIGHPPLSPSHLPPPFPPFLFSLGEASPRAAPTHASDD